MFENKVLGKIFRAKSVEIRGEWSKHVMLSNDAFYSSRKMIRNRKSISLRWAGHVVRMEQFINAYRVLVGRAE